MNIINKTINYIKGSVVEMRKVTWPTKQETKNYTILVIAISLAVAIYLGGLDYLFNLLFELILR